MSRIIEFVKIRTAQLSDLEILLEWRNDFETRKNSHNTDTIDEVNHKKWLESTLANENIQLFIALFNNNQIGTVRADYNSNLDSWEISWTIAANYRGLGYGKAMVKCLTDRLKGRFRAEIKEGNTSSIKIAEFCKMSFNKKSNGILYYSNY
ncbi:MAG: GNAT family N-acetyltransferase [Bacteroidota bacterium]